MVDGFCGSQCLFISPQKFREALASFWSQGNWPAGFRLHSPELGIAGV